MKKFAKIVLVLLSVMIVTCTVIIGASAASDDAFSITTPDGVETIYKDYTQLPTVISNITSGSTVKILSDINIVAASSATYINLPQEKTVYFDLNGHYYSLSGYGETNFKPSMFALNTNSKIYLYSSKPGGRLMLSSYTDSNIYGHALFTTSAEGAEIHIGAYGDYDGNNLSTHSGVLFDTSSPYTSTKLVIDGGYYSRTTKQSHGLIINRGKATVTANDATFATTIGYLLTTYGESDAVENSMTFNNCTFSSINPLFNRLYGFGTSATFNECYFLCNPQVANGTKTGNLVLNRCRIYDEAHLVASRKHVNTYEVKDVTLKTNVFKYNQTTGGYEINSSSFNSVTSRQTYVFRYATAVSGEYSTITWQNPDGDKVSEEWLNGSTPIPSSKLALPDATAAYKYGFSDVSAVTQNTTYVAKAEDNFNLYTSISISSDFIYNLYFPAAVKPFIASLKMNGEEVTDYALTTIAGEGECYKISCNIPAAYAASSFPVVFTVSAYNGESFEVSESLSIPEYAKKIIGGGYNESTVALMNSALAYIKAAGTYFDRDVSLIGDVTNASAVAGKAPTAVPSSVKSVFSGVQLALDGALKFRFNVKEGVTAGTAVFKYTKGTAEKTLTVTEADWLVDGNGKYYEIAIPAGSLMQPVTVTVNGESFVYSLDNYVYFVNNLKPNLTQRKESLMTLVYNLYAYAECARDFIDEPPTVTLTIAGNSLDKYTIVAATELENEAAKKLQTAIAAKFGITLPISSSSSGPMIKVSLLGYNTAYDFRAKVVGTDLYLDCGLRSFMVGGMETFADEYVTSLTTSLDFSSDFSKSFFSDKLYYTDFGAKGDGVTDDFLAVRATHVTANENRRYTVYADEGLTFRIASAYYNGSVCMIPIKTDTVWEGATIVFDDRHVVPGTDEGNYHLFCVESDYKSVTYNETNSSYVSNLTINAETVTKLDLGLGYPAMLIVYNDRHQSHIRYGSVGYTGTVQRELVVVDKDGNIDPTTPFLHDYSDVTKIIVIRLDEKPITVKGGTVNTIVPTVDISGTNGVTGSSYVSRGILISRSNTTFVGVKHYVQEERTSGSTPSYNGFVLPASTSNITFENCVFTGRKYYGISGTYDIGGSMSNNITFKNCTQSNFKLSNGNYSMKGTAYWGIMGTNYCKNMTYDGCTLSRFDSHSSLYNGKIINSTVNVISITGGGTMLIEGSTIQCTGTGSISLRNDYGSTWKGDVIIRNTAIHENGYVTKESSTSYRYNLITVYWANHNFGYTCYIPNITIDNITFDTAKKNLKVNIFNTAGYTHTDGETNFVWNTPSEKKINSQKLADGTVNNNVVVMPTYIKVTNNKGGFSYYLKNTSGVFNSTALTGVNKE